MQRQLVLDKRTFDTLAPKLTRGGAKTRRQAEIFVMEHYLIILFVSLVLSNAACGQECSTGQYNARHCLKLPATYKRAKSYFFTSREELTYEFTNNCENEVYLIAVPQSGEKITKN